MSSPLPHHSILLVAIGGPDRGAFTVRLLPWRHLFIPLLALYDHGQCRLVASASPAGDILVSWT